MSRIGFDHDVHMGNAWMGAFIVSHERGDEEGASTDFGHQPILLQSQSADDLFMRGEKPMNLGKDGRGIAIHMRLHCLVGGLNLEY